MRFQVSHLGTGNRNHVDGMSNFIFSEEVRNNLCGFKCHHFLGFVSRGAQVGSGQHVGSVDQTSVFGRFLGKYVTGGTGDFSGFQGICQIVFIHDATAGTVDDSHARSHCGDPRGVNQVTCFIGQGCMNCQEVTMLDQFIDFFVKFDAILGGTL